MNLSTPFIRRPVATTLLTLGRARWRAPSPSSCCRSRRCRRSISRPSRCRRSCRAPAPRSWRPPSRRRSSAISAQIADVTEMTSSSTVGVDAHHPAVRPRPRHRRRRARRAGGDQRGARRPADQPAQQPDLPQGQPGRRADPDPGADLGHADAGASSTTRPRPCWQQKLSQVEGIGEVDVGGSSLPAVRVELNPQRALQIRHRPRGRARGARRRQCAQPEGRDRGRRPALPDLRQRPGAARPPTTDR